MPLPPATAPRQLLHRRRLELLGYKREDGNYDLEARLTDTKDHDFRLASGVRKQGEPIHDMLIRVTLDPRGTILDTSVLSEATPYPTYCDRIAPDYKKLVGLNLLKGFRRAVNERFRDAHGCAHLTELAMALPPAVIQTFASEAVDEDSRDRKPFQLDRCHALVASSDAVARYYPRWYTGSQHPDSVEDGRHSAGQNP